MQTSFLTIRQLYRRHKEENPDSVLGEKAIRSAVKDGSLKHRTVGTRVYVEYGAFIEWLKGGCDE